MDIDKFLSGLPASPSQIRIPMREETFKRIPFAGLVGTNPKTFPFVLQIKPEKDLTPHDRKLIHVFKWMREETYAGLQLLGTPSEVLINFGKHKFEDRFVLEIIEAITCGSEGVEGRYDYTQNGQMPVVGRLIYGTTDGGDFTEYAPVPNMTFPAKVHADLNATTANLSVQLARRLYTMAISITPQPALHPCFVSREGQPPKSSFYAFVTLETAEWLENNDKDFKNPKSEDEAQSARQANPLNNHLIFAHIGSITFIKCPELQEYAAFDENGLNPDGPYHHNFLVGCDAVRILKSTLDDGIIMSINTSSHEAQMNKVIKVDYSYKKGYKCPAYINKASGLRNGTQGVNKWQLAESGVIHFITKVA